MIEINEAVARKVLETVDAGLTFGLGSPQPGSMCVEAAVCYALGLPHSDDPKCVSPAIRALKIQLNDSSYWSSNKARAVGLRRFAIAQLGSNDNFDNIEFARKVSKMTIQTILPPMLRKIGLNEIADRCEIEGTQVAAQAAAYAASAGYAAASAARYAAASAADAYAAASAADAYAAASASAASAARYAAASAASASAAASDAAASDAASDAAASDAASDAAADKILSDFSENVVQILIQMNAPGVGWLYLTEI